MVESSDFETTGNPTGLRRGLITIRRNQSRKVENLIFKFVVITNGRDLKIRDYWISEYVLLK